MWLIVELWWLVTVNYINNEKDNIRKEIIGIEQTCSVLGTCVSKLDSIPKSFHFCIFLHIYMPRQRWTLKPWNSGSNMSVLLWPWSQLFCCWLPGLIDLLFAACSADTGCLLWPMLSTKQGAAHYLAAHPSGRILINITVSLQQVFRELQDFLKGSFYHQVFWSYLQRTKADWCNYS